MNESVKHKSVIFTQLANAFPVCVLQLVSLEFSWHTRRNGSNHKILSTQSRLGLRPSLIENELIFEILTWNPIK